jgi:hypothetical protein
MHQSRTFGSVRCAVAATSLLQAHGAGSAGEASDRADERFNNIDVGGYAYWKSVEQLIRKNQQADAL